MPFKSIASEIQSVTEEVIAPWTESFPLTILFCHLRKDIFNAGEFGLSFKSLPNQILHLEGKKCLG